MCEKTVIARALKIESSSSSDKGLLTDKTAIDVQHEIKTEANKEPLNFDASKIEDAVVEDAEIVSPEGEQPQETLFEKETPSKPGF